MLSISNSEILAEKLGFELDQIRNVTYPEFNMLDLPFETNQFDSIVSDQVLEHIEGNPQQAIDEAFRVIKPNGLALHTTCFINPVHGEPNDFWRFTPYALKLMVAEKGDLVDVGGWGNPYAWLFMGLGLRYEPIPHARWHPAHWIATADRHDWPISTWVLARKRGPMADVGGSSASSASAQREKSSSRFDVRSVSRR